MTDTMAAAPQRERGKTFQIVWSLIIFAAFAVLLFVPDAAYYGTSLAALALAAMKGDMEGNALAYASVYVLIAAYALLLVCTVAPFFCGRLGALIYNCFKTIVMVAAFVFFTIALMQNYGLNIPDIFYDGRTFLAINSVAIALLAGLIALIVCSFSAYHGRGGLKLVNVLLALAFFALGNLPFLEGYTLFTLFGKVTLAGGALAGATAVFFRILAWATFANLALAVIGLVIPRTATIAAVRAALHCLLAAAALILLGSYASWGNLPGYSGTIAYTALALAQLLYAAITLAILRRRNHTRRAEPLHNPAGTPIAAPAMPGMPVSAIPAMQPEQEPEYENAMRTAVDDLLAQERLAARCRPDTFLSSLTDEERKEFEDLFVDRIYGESLPLYTAGEDNAAFFRNVFIRLGKYRDVISDDLLEKMYDYSQKDAKRN